MTSLENMLLNHKYIYYKKLTHLPGHEHLKPKLQLAEKKNPSMLWHHICSNQKKCPRIICSNKKINHVAKRKHAQKHNGARIVKTQHWNGESRSKIQKAQQNDRAWWTSTKKTENASIAKNISSGVTIVSSLQRHITIGLNWTDQAAGLGSSPNHWADAGFWLSGFLRAMSECALEITISSIGRRRCNWLYKRL